MRSASAASGRNLILAEVVGGLFALILLLSGLRQIFADLDARELPRVDDHARALRETLEGVSAAPQREREIIAARPIENDRNCANRPTDGAERRLQDGPLVECRLITAIARIGRQKQKGVRLAQFRQPWQ